jgi:hypothetical protein
MEAWYARHSAMLHHKRIQTNDAHHSRCKALQGGESKTCSQLLRQLRQVESLAHPLTSMHTAPRYCGEVKICGSPLAVVKHVKRIQKVKRYRGVFLSSTTKFEDDVFGAIV